MATGPGASSNGNWEEICAKANEEGAINRSPQWKHFEKRTIHIKKGIFWWVVVHRPWKRKTPRTSQQKTLMSSWRPERFATIELSTSGRLSGVHVAGQVFSSFVLSILLSTGGRKMQTEVLNHGKRKILRLRREEAALKDREHRLSAAPCLICS